MRLAASLVQVTQWVVGGVFLAMLKVWHMNPPVPWAAAAVAIERPSVRALAANVVRIVMGSLPNRSLRKPDGIRH
jgi:hypothetical protein